MSVICILISDFKIEPCFKMLILIYYVVIYYKICTPIQKCLDPHCPTVCRGREDSRCGVCVDISLSRENKAFIVKLVIRVV